MSSTDGDGDDSGPGTREVAHRLFAAEFDDASLEYSESDEERAPNYVVTPTGLRVNRLFAVGVLTEVESVNEETVRGRLVDPTGAFVTYAGQYQPEELAFLERTTPPSFAALTGKARTFEPDDADVVYTSVRPESVSEVDADTRDRWAVSTAEATLDRLAVLAAALELDERGDALRARLDAAGAPEALAAGIPRALEHYGTTPAYVEAVRRVAVDALEVVADEREEVRALTTDPDSASPAEIGPLPDHGLDLSAASEPTVEAEAPADEAVAGESATTDSVEATESEPEPTTSEASAATTSDETRSEEGAEPAEATATAGAADSGAAGAVTETDADTDTGTRADAEPEAEADPETEPESSAVETSASDDESTESSDESDLEESDAGTDEDAALDDFEDEDLGDFEDAVSDEERREVEEEHGVEFSSGSDVSEPGEADIETPEPAAEEESADDVESADDEVEAEEATDEDATATSEDETADAGDAPADVDVEDAVVDLMDELDDGDGADRDEVVATAAERYGVSEEEADDAVQDALMSGKCYEPSEGTLKSI